MRLPTAAAFTSVAGFSLALGMAHVAVPLLVLDAGYSGVELGLLVTLSAVAQLGFRTTVPAVSRRVPDRVLVGGANALLAMSCLVAAVSPNLLVLVVAMALQGAARGYFWSGSQLHAVHGAQSTLHAIAHVNLVSSAGLILGPVVAGAISESSNSIALAGGAAVATASSAISLLMRRHDPVVRGDETRVRVWRVPEALAGSWASVCAGVWSAFIVSYIPVVLAQQFSPTSVGLLIALSTGGNVVGSVVIARAGDPPTWRRGCAAANGIALAALAPASSAPALVAALVLLVSGLASGALLTLGPAMATASVRPEEHIDAIAMAGSFRACALLATPLAVAGLSLLLPLGLALAVTAMGANAPAVLLRGRHRPQARGRPPCTPP